jgi:hypothetical protein
VKGNCIHSQRRPTSEADRAARVQIGGFFAFAGDLVLRYTLHGAARRLMRVPSGATRER